MSTQQDIYAAGFENHPPMLNKDNYVLWSSLIIRYARSRPNGKMIVDFIENGPYVRRMIATPGEPDLPVSPGMNMSQDRQIQNIGGNVGNQFGQYARQVAQNQQGYNAWQNGGIQVAQNAVQNAGVQNGEEFDFMAAAGDLNEIEEVNANCILMGNLQHASTSGTQLDKAPVYDIDGSTE
nr:hypothetical protein [Tanacetum cinerariifolium]